MIINREDALTAIDSAWPTICQEGLAVLGSELHYQAMIYHALRSAGGVPLNQLGMNVKQWIPNVRSELFKRFDEAKHEDYRGGFEPIPDVVIFSPAVEGDWRRRRAEYTLKCMLAVIEVKASERQDGRLYFDEIAKDIRKLSAHREEVLHLGFDFHPIVLVVDSAPEKAERMTKWSVEECRKLARERDVEWRYLSREEIQVERPALLRA